jgi:hypothetical protein
MTYDGLVNLWQIGRSRKRDAEIEKRSHRKQIGKFGIGKLATYTVANQLTYITKSPQGILGVTIDFTQFDAGHDEGIETEREIELTDLALINWTFDKAVTTSTKVGG